MHRCIDLRTITQQVVSCTFNKRRQKALLSNSRIFLCTELKVQEMLLFRDGIFKSFMEPWNRSQPGGPVQQPYLSYQPARLHSLAESIPRNQFLGSINVYKYGLSCSVTTEMTHQILPTDYYKNTPQLGQDRVAATF
jgi:hypothetical protein